MYFFSEIYFGQQLRQASEIEISDRLLVLGRVVGWPELSEEFSLGNKRVQGGTRVTWYDSKVRLLKLEPGTFLILLVASDQLKIEELKLASR